MKEIKIIVIAARMLSVQIRGRKTERGRVELKNEFHSNERNQSAIVVERTENKRI